VTVRRVIMVGAVLASLAFASAARASLIASDSFGYPAAAGGLAGQNGGTGWTSDWDTGTNNVVSPGLTYSKNGVSLVTSGNSSETVGGNTGNFRSLPSTFSSGTVYVSFLGKLDNANGTIGSSYAGVSLFNAGSEPVHRPGDGPCRLGRGPSHRCDTEFHAGRRHHPPVRYPD
jgi:hypothetical protein